MHLEVVEIGVCVVWPYVRSVEMEKSLPKQSFTTKWQSKNKVHQNCIKKRSNSSYKVSQPVRKGFQAQSLLALKPVLKPSCVEICDTGEDCNLTHPRTAGHRGLCRILPWSAFWKPETAGYSCLVTVSLNCRVIKI